MAEMITENEAKSKIEAIKPLQENGAFCICSDCGVDEAMRHHTKEKQLPFTEWDVVKRNDKILERN